MAATAARVNAGCQTNALFTTYQIHVVGLAVEIYSETCDYKLFSKLRKFDTNTLFAARCDEPQRGRSTFGLALFDVNG